MAGRKRNAPPRCERCGASEGAEFNVFGVFTFGKYCVPCERAIVDGGEPAESPQSDEPPAPGTRVAPQDGARRARSISELSATEREELRQCSHEGESSWGEVDARGIYLCRVCDRCQEVKLSQYRPEILTGYSQADVDEPIEPDDWSPGWGDA